MLSLFDRRPPSEIEVAHNGEIYRVALRRMPTSRRYTLRVRAALRDVLLTMPARASLKGARDFAQRHAAWIGARLARLPQPVAFAPGETAPLRGVDHTIVHRPGARGVVWTISSARRGAIWRPPSRATPARLTSSRAASACATPRAAGARAPRRACSISPGV
jgi:predicted metal-dependent hydrolase